MFLNMIALEIPLNFIGAFSELSRDFVAIRSEIIRVV